MVNPVGALVYFEKVGAYYIKIAQQLKPNRTRKSIYNCLFLKFPLNSKATMQTNQQSQQDLNLPQEDPESCQIVTSKSRINKIQESSGRGFQGASEKEAPLAHYNWGQLPESFEPTPRVFWQVGRWGFEK